MSATLIIFACLAAPTGDGPTLALEDPAIVGARFEMPLRGPAATLARAETHLEGRRVVIFFPALHATPGERTFRDGPVQRVKIGSARRGTPVTLRLREPLDGESVRILPGPPATLLVEGARHAAAPVDLSPPVSTKASPLAAGAEPVAQNETLSRGPLQASMFQPPEAVGRPIATSMVIGMVLLALAGIGWVWRRQRAKAGLANNGSIDIVAVRGFGNKHRLALVDTCGERFLLASSDKEVRVLGHLGTESTERFSDALGAAGADPEAPKLDLTTETPEESSGDLAGLLRLRRAKAPAAMRFPLRALGRDDDGVAA